MNAAPSAIIDRVKRNLVGLRMPRALEILDVTLRAVERGEATALDVLDILLAEEITLRENRRVRMALQMARLSAVKTLAGFDFSFQPSLDKSRVMALAELQFIDRAEAVHLIGPPGTGKTHLCLALGVEAVKAGRSVYFASLADIIAVLARAEREGTLREKIRYFCRFALLIVDEIGNLPVTPGGGNLFFQLVNASYEKGAMILTSNRGFAEWGDIFGDAVVATALLDRLLHHAVVFQIEGSSYRLREHADLLPEHVRTKASIQPAPIPPTLRRRGRPPKNGGADQIAGRSPCPPDWGILLRRFWGIKIGIYRGRRVGIADMSGAPGLPGPRISDHRKAPYEHWRAWTTSVNGQTFSEQLSDIERPYARKTERSPNSSGCSDTA